eukprot:TRINITY_DN22270_c0_g3_i1.p1 TRINITY_DN22270_c0_g3~~TRINITY_DN22270_c0_g3_i1.p1  ORF type:complete len:898 (+),score=210.45 TRINITY_DN22270_c0_g3_i1:183-2876(+)
MRRAPRLWWHAALLALASHSAAAPGAGRTVLLAGGRRGASRRGSLDAPRERRGRQQHAPAAAGTQPAPGEAPGGSAGGALRRRAVLAELARRSASAPQRGAPPPAASPPPAPVATPGQSQRPPPAAAVVQPQRRRRADVAMFSSVQWARAPRSCLWEASQQQNTTVVIRPLPSLDACRAECLMTPGCPGVQWFTQELNCVVFDSSCDLLRTGGAADEEEEDAEEAPGRSQERWEAQQQPVWWQELFKATEVWCLVNVTETQSFSLSLPTATSSGQVTQSASGALTVTATLPSASRTATLPASVSSSMRFPDWVNWLPVPLAEALLVAAAAAGCGFGAWRLLGRRRRGKDYRQLAHGPPSPAAAAESELGPSAAGSAGARAPPSGAPLPPLASPLAPASIPPPPDGGGAGGSPREWQRGRLLGRGSYGKVYLGVLGDGSLMAVKVVPLPEGTGERQLLSAMREVEALVDLAHPRVVRCYGCNYDPRESELHLFMEYMQGGSLGRLVRALGKPLEESAAASYAEQVVDGVAHLHSCGVVHRDLKGDNILLTGEGRAKIGDFGACRSLAASCGRSAPCGVVGTPCWMPPEALRLSTAGGGQSCAGDVWACGIIACELLDEGRVPWPEFDSPIQACYIISRWQGDLPPRVPADAASGLPLSDECLGFLRACLAPLPETRWGAAALRQHPWLQRRWARRCSSSLPSTESPLCATTGGAARPGGAVSVRRGEDLCQLYRHRYPSDSSGGSGGSGGSGHCASSDSGSAPSPPATASLPPHPAPDPAACGVAGGQPELCHPQEPCQVSSSSSGGPGHGSPPSPPSTDSGGSPGGAPVPSPSAPAAGLVPLQGGPSIALQPLLGAPHGEGVAPFRRHGAALHSLQSASMESPTDVPGSGSWLSGTL